ncbi:MAG: O-antigen ligase family protein [Patescibacteria group bacterium]|jgi:O-antigen ligase
MIFLAIFLGLVSLITAWHKPVWAALLIFALLPAYNLRLTIFALPTTILEVIILTAVLGAIANWLKHRSPFPIIPKWLWSAIGAWLIIGLFGVWVSTNHYQALGLFRAYIIEPALLVPLFYLLAESEKYRKQFLFLASLQLIILSLVAIGQRLGWFYSPKPWINENPVRVVGLFAYPNALALYVAPLTALLFGTWLKLKNQVLWPERHLWIISAFFGLVACFLANSRGAILALGLGVVVSGFFVKRKWLWLGICALALAGMLAIPAVHQKAIQIVSGQDVSTDVRQVLWQGTWRLIKARPLTGSGLGNFPTVYKKYKLPQHIEFLQYPHNLILNVWVELGLPGLIFSIVLIFWLIIKLFKHFKEKNPFALAGLLAWLVIISHGLVDVPFFKNDLSVLTVLLFCLAIFLPKTDKDKNKIPS